MANSLLLSNTSLCFPPSLWLVLRSISRTHLRYLPHKSITASQHTHTHTHTQWSVETKEERWRMRDGSNRENMRQNHPMLKIEEERRAKIREREMNVDNKWGKCQIETLRFKKMVGKLRIVRIKKMANAHKWICHTHTHSTWQTGK